LTDRPPLGNIAFDAESSRRKKLLAVHIDRPKSIYSCKKNPDMNWRAGQHVLALAGYNFESEGGLLWLPLQLNSNFQVILRL
jgi:hypothetical protein